MEQFAAGTADAWVLTRPYCSLFRSASISVAQFARSQTLGQGFFQGHSNHMSGTSQSRTVLRPVIALPAVRRDILNRHAAVDGSLHMRSVSIGEQEYRHRQNGRTSLYPVSQAAPLPESHTIPTASEHRGKRTKVAADKPLPALHLPDASKTSCSVLIPCYATQRDDRIVRDRSSQGRPRFPRSLVVSGSRAERLCSPSPLTSGALSCVIMAKMRAAAGGQCG